MSLVTLEGFDGGLELLGGREQIEENALRVGSGLNPVHMRSAKSRWGTSAIYTGSSIDLVAVDRMYQTRIGVDSNGKVWWLPDGSVGITATWAASTSFPIGTQIVDSNGNIQKSGGGTSGGPSHPVWATTLNATTADGTITWTMVAGVIKTLTAGLAPASIKSAPHFGAIAQMFLVGGGTNIKIDKFGTVTNLGIAPPADGMTGVATAPPVSVAIDNLDATTGWTPNANCTLSTDTAQFVFSTASLVATIKPRSVGRWQKTNAVNLVPANSTDDDAIYLYVAIDKPQYITAFTLDFDLGTNYTTNYYSASIPISEFVAVQSNKAVNDLFNFDDITFSVLQQPTKPSHPFLVPNGWSGEAQRTLQNYLRNIPASLQTRTVFKPSSGALQEMVGTATSVAQGPDEWWLIRVPKRVFARRGTSVNTWANVSGYRFRVHCQHSSDSVQIHMNQLILSGGVGMLGDYQYLVSFLNTNTGSYSNPNPTPVVVKNLDRQGASLASIPTSTDPQVNARIIWRTVGNGGFYFKAAIINDNVTTTYADTASDFFGFGPTDSNANVLSIEPLLQVNVPVSATVTNGIEYLGTTFFCGDTSAGNRGRFYYSAPGFEEAVAGFTDVTNDDDPLQGFAIYNGTLYLFSQSTVFEIEDHSQSVAFPVYAAVELDGVEGVLDASSIVTTPLGVVYRSGSGLYLFNGNKSEPIAPKIRPLFRGETVEGYPPIGTIIAADYARDEYIFSDGTHCYAVNLAQDIRDVSATVTAMAWDADVKEIQVGANGTFWGLLEHPGQTSDNGSPIVYALQPRSIYAGIKTEFNVSRIFIDCNPNGDTLTATLLVDNTTVALNGPTITGSSRNVFEFTTNQHGRLIGVKLTGNLTHSPIEIFKIVAELEGAEE